MSDLFFYASKIGWFLAAPSNALIVFVTVGWMLQRTMRHARFGGRLLGLGVLGLALCTLTPLSNVMLSSLESRFEPLAAGYDCETVRGILVLGGAAGIVRTGHHSHAQLNDAADRLHYAAELAQRCPNADIVLLGGQVFARPAVPSEAEIMSEVLDELGVDRSRMTAVGGSRTTFENADSARSALADEASENTAWLLVTSAFHMPRAMGVFRQAGFDVVAAPTDWRLDADAPILFVSGAERLSRADLASKEFLGLLMYRVTGRTDALWPSPKAIAEDDEHASAR